MPITPEQIADLINSPYRDQIPVWADLPPDPVRRVTETRSRFPLQYVSAILELSELRHRARDKFAHPESMFFDREALEQATASEIAQDRAARFEDTADSLADLTCGIGSDALHLARAVPGPISVADISEARVRIARENFHSLYTGPLAPILSRVTFRTAPAEDHPEAEAFFLDPSRRTGGKRSRHLEGMSPGSELILDLSRRAKAMAVKLSPATPDEELALLGGRVEFVSWRGECREAVVWYGNAGPASARSARIIGTGSLNQSPGAPDPPVSPPLRYLLEPDPAIVRAGLIPELCRKINAAVLDPLVAYLTSDTAGPNPWTSGYEILQSLPFSAKSLRAALRDHGIGQVEVKKRASAVDVDALRRQLDSTLPGEGTVVVTRIGLKPHAFICRRLRTPAP